VVTISVDQEHGSLRLIVVVLFLVIWAGVYAIANMLIPDAGLNLIAILVGFGAAALLTRLIEPRLKDRLPSGRRLEIDAGGIRLKLRDQLQEEIKAGEPVSALLWHFKIKRRSRVPKGWSVVACALEQDERYLAVYTFASPEQVVTLNKIVTFTEMVSEKKQGRNSKQDSLRVAGEQRRLRLAEMHRWNFGAELTYDDFERYLNQLNGQFPLWLP
jgi:hypothetical protein